MDRTLFCMFMQIMTSSLLFTSINQVITQVSIDNYMKINLWFCSGYMDSLMKMNTVLG